MKLYKFRTVNTNALTLMSNNQLWFSAFSSFNDPFEGTYILDGDFSDEELSKYKIISKEEMGDAEYNEMLTSLGLKDGEFTKKELFLKLAEHDFKKFISVTHGAHISSFSLCDNEKDPIGENLMWSHYAAGLRGFCLVFDYEKLLQDIKASSKAAIMPIKVSYQDKPNTLRLLDFVQSNGVLGREEDDDYVQTATQTIATKSEVWAYENELRILSLDTVNLHRYTTETLIEIILGDKMPETHEKLILDIAKSNNNNISIKKAKLIPNSYNIEIVDM
ncbi:MAG: DUF2971 domain-containing protein [Candidatus Heimdallarchaeota archaeon]|nr:DUF2971 domain-containing protein [Candidatus Heimdallarchaeota archaeon]